MTFRETPKELSLQQPRRTPPVTPHMVRCTGRPGGDDYIIATSPRKYEGDAMCLASHPKQRHLKRLAPRTGSQAQRNRIRFAATLRQVVDAEGSQRKEHTLRERVLPKH